LSAAIAQSVNVSRIAVERVRRLNLVRERVGVVSRGRTSARVPGEGEKEMRLSDRIFIAIGVWYPAPVIVPKGELPFRGKGNDYGQHDHVYG
jgi:hypothetical protein